MSFPLREPFVTGTGRVDVRTVLLVRVETAGGTEGWGEVSAFDAPFYDPETVDSAAACLTRFLIPALLDARVQTPAEVPAALRPVRGHHMAKAGLEGAVWDAAARERGVSLSSLLGGTRARVAAGAVLGTAEDVPSLLEAARAIVGTGVQRVKLKIRPGWDVAPLRAVREAYPTLPLAADANGTLVDAEETVFAALDGCELAFIEQPFTGGDLVDHAALSARLETPVCLDESLASEGDARSAIRLGAARAFNVKAGRLGGLTAATAVLELGESNGVEVWCGGLLESCIGRQHVIALASRPEVQSPGDVTGTDRYTDVDFVDPPIRVGAGGWLPVPETPGIGRVDEAAVRAHTTETWDAGWTSGRG